MNSHSSSVSDQSAPRLLSEEFDSGAARAYDSSEKDLGNVYRTCTFYTCYSKGVLVWQGLDGTDIDLYF